MSNSSINSTDLKSFLSRFFEKNFEISDKILIISEKFLFYNVKNTDVKNQQELHNTLLYLKDVMECNDLKTLDDLIQYYDKKRKKISALIEKLEENDPEECFALDFQHACTMYMKPIKEEHIFKSNCLYYLQSSNYYTVEFSPPYLYSPKIDILLYSSTDEQERIFMAQVKGNLLNSDKKKCCAQKGRIDEMVSN